MVVDTSALICILQQEPEAGEFAHALETADSRILSAAAWVEASLVILNRFGDMGLYYLDRFLERAGMQIRAVDREQAEIARRAFQRFGKGRHPARLNFGDCFSYALAMQLGDSLLQKGLDFPQTDVRLAKTGT